MTRAFGRGVTTARAFGQWVVAGALVVAIAVALHRLWPLVSGHVAMGLATALLVLAMYGGRAVASRVR